jgi:hypothetical protein
MIMAELRTLRFQRLLRAGVFDPGELGCVDWSAAQRRFAARLGPLRGSRAY